MFVMSVRRRNGRRRARRRQLTSLQRSGWLMAISSHEIAMSKSSGQAFLASCLCSGIYFIYWLPVPQRGAATLVIQLLVREKSGKRLGSRQHVPAPPHFCVADCLRWHFLSLPACMVSASASWSWACSSAISLWRSLLRSLTCTCSFVSTLNNANVLIKGS